MLCLEAMACLLQQINHDVRFLGSAGKVAKATCSVKLDVELDASSTALYIGYSACTSRPVTSTCAVFQQDP